VSERNEAIEDRKVPALVVSGFLGSGKTTLIRHILAEATRRAVKVALVSNELGALGVDRALLGDGGEAYVELEGGCVCCELSDDLILTLQNLYENVSPDRIVVETSGVALPWDTQLNFWRHPVRDWIGDDMAVVVVNAEQLCEGRDLEGTFTDQVTSADLLILNKIDLVDEAGLALAHERLRSIEPEAPVVTARHGAVDVALLFPPDADQVDRSGAIPEAPSHTHEQFETEIWTPPVGLSAEQLETELSQPHLLRAKGFVQTDQGPRLVQVVGHRVELHEIEYTPPDSLEGRVVLIRRADQSKP